jgi:CrcB protein
MAMKIAALAVAGALGTLSRYALGGLVQHLCGDRFPWGTLAVNSLGCFLFGLVWVLAAERVRISPETRLIVLVGFMGAFTTFSTLVFETQTLMRDSQWLLAAGNYLGQSVLGVALLLLGMALGKML